MSRPRTFTHSATFVPASVPPARARSVASLMCLCVALPVSGLAQATIYSGKAEVLVQGFPIVSTTVGGDTPDVALMGPVTFGTGTGKAEATTTARGVVAASESVSAGDVVSSVATSTAQYDDLIFSIDDPDLVDIGPLQAVLRYNLSASQNASGALGTIGGFNRREVSFTVVFHDSFDTGRVRWDVKGDQGQELLGEKTLAAFDVPINTPVILSLGLAAGTNARQSAANVTTSTLLFSSLMAGGASAFPGSFQRGAGASGALGEPVRVFDLPPGYTVNSVSMGIVDNVLVAPPVPEPATWALWLGGAAALLGWRRRRDSFGRAATGAAALA